MGNMLSIFGDILLFLLALWCTHFFSLMIHELGHALAYAFAVKDNNWIIEIGSGRKIIETTRFKIHLAVFSGYFKPKTEQYSSRKNAIITLLGGPIASLLSLLALSIIKFSFHVKGTRFFNLSAASFLLNYALVYNIVLFISSSLPTKKSIWPVRGYISDGYKIRRLLSK